MACAALKRSIDWDPLSSPSSRPSKRMRGPTTPLRDPSPFAIRPTAQTAAEISASIQQESKRFQRQQQHQRQCLSPTAATTCLMQAVAAASACPSSQSAADLLLMSSPSCSSVYSASTASSPISLSCTSAQQTAATPVFTFKQVGLICERLLRDQENQIREEYDKVLETKLAEQYDTFVKFTYDQIQKRFEAGATPSYLS